MKLLRKEVIVAMKAAVAFYAECVEARNKYQEKRQTLVQEAENISQEISRECRANPDTIEHKLIIVRPAYRLLVPVPSPSNRDALDSLESYPVHIDRYVVDVELTGPKVDRLKEAAMRLNSLDKEWQNSPARTFLNSDNDKRSLLLADMEARLADLERSRAKTVPIPMKIAQYLLDRGYYEISDPEVEK
jgi:hypothetical protein